MLNSNLSGGSAAGQCVLGAFVIVTSRTRSVRYCGKNMLDIKRFSLPSTIMMRNDKRRLAHAMRLFALRFKLEFEAAGGIIFVSRGILLLAEQKIST